MKVDLFHFPFIHFIFDEPRDTHHIIRFRRPAYLHVVYILDYTCVLYVHVYIQHGHTNGYGRASHKNSLLVTIRSRVRWIILAPAIVRTVTHSKRLNAGT